MYVDPDNSSVIQINGTSANQFQGTIYAPSSLVKINGTSDSQTLKTQVIAKTIEISGNASLQMNQGSCDEYKDPPLIELFKVKDKGFFDQTSRAILDSIALDVSGQ